MALIRAGALVASLLSLSASCSLGATQTEHAATSAAPAEKLRTFSDHGITLRYPPGWSLVGFSTTVLPARLAVASYPLPADAVEGDCGGLTAVEALPRDGALVILIDYGQAAAAEFAARPARLRLRDGKYDNYECFGASTMFRFRAGGRALQAHLALGHHADSSVSRQALAVLDSIVVKARGV
jgi:hypothetical protein